MADNISITEGVGTDIATDELADGSHAQRMKLLYSDTSGTDIGADVNGLDVDVTRVGGNVTVVQSTATNLKVDASGVAVPVTDNAGSLTVDAPVTTPVFVRLSDGSAAITALPITDNSGLISVDDGDGSLTVDGTVAATQSGTWNIGTVTTITGPVPITDNSGLISVDDGDGSLTVDGTVTAIQGTAAASSGGWPVKLTDGTINATLTAVASDNCLDVNVVQSVGPVTQADRSAFTEGTTKILPIGGVFNETISADPTEDQAAALRITAKSGLHVNLRDVAGTEMGTAGDPLRVDPTGDTNQPVDLFDATGTAFSQTNEVPVHNSNVGKTIYSLRVTYSASQSNQTLLTPATGKKFVVVSIHVKVTGAGDLEIYDDASAAGTMLLAGTYAVADILSQEYPGGRPSAAADNVLKYDTGSGATGDIVVFGYDSD
jgi:hypothetical protein